MADQARLQVKTVKDPEKWSDVGAGPIGVPVPVVLEDSLPTDNGNNNASYEIAYNGDEIDTITQTVGATSYVKTLTYTNGLITDISEWVEI